MIFRRKTVSMPLLALLLTSMFAMVLNAQPAQEEHSPLNVSAWPSTTQQTSMQASGESPPTQWNRTYGGTSYDYAWALVETSDGGYALAGVTESFGAGSYDFWLVKTDSAGNALWNKTYGGTSSDWAWALVETSDGGYALAGYTDSFGAGSYDAWLVKTDAYGNVQWNKTYGGTSDDYARALVETTDGGYALAGETLSFGAVGGDVWLVKVDAMGNHVWNKTYGGTMWDRALALVKTSDGGYALAGGTFSFGAVGGDVWLVKTDSAGNALWNKTYGQHHREEAWALVETSDGGYALAGYTDSFGAGSYDFWLVKTDSAGNALWNQTYGGTGTEHAFALVETSDGGYALAGMTWSFGAGDEDVWLVKTDSAGNMMWNKTYGGTSSDWAYALVEASDGGYALAGGTRSFGAGYSDFWLVKVATDKYDVTIQAYCYTGDAPVSVSITMDGSPTGYTTPHTFTGLTGTHTFTVPSTDQHNHPFQHWNTGETSTTITVTTAGTYTAYYKAPPPSVGGVQISVDKFALLAPYIGLASTILAATVATAVYANRVKRKKKNQ